MHVFAVTANEMLKPHIRQITLGRFSTYLLRCYSVLMQDRIERPVILLIIPAGGQVVDGWD